MQYSDWRTHACGHFGDLNAGESMVTEKGSMVWMSPNMGNEDLRRRQSGQGVWTDVFR